MILFEEKKFFEFNFVPMMFQPPLECGMNIRSHGYCEPHTWPHYQVNMTTSTYYKI